jgi:hypothetical protein
MLRLGILSSPWYMCKGGVGIEILAALCEELCTGISCGIQIFVIDQRRKWTRVVKVTWQSMQDITLRYPANVYELSLKIVGTHHGCRSEPFFVHMNSLLLYYGTFCWWLVIVAVGSVGISDGPGR